jgi:DMSO/TMAO reductase YedYZ molybdopterin-dependent catalytic subunit
MLNRRQFVTAAASAPLLLAGCRLTPTPQVEEAGVLRFPGKVPMRAINDRPPCLETPWRFFSEDLTPNEAFYVRWHLQMIPTSIDVRTWRLRVGGEVEKPLSLSLDDLRKMERVSVVAVNQCSGNSRALFGPAVPGAQWGNGGMGNAVWSGVPLRSVLKLAGLKAKAVEVSFRGMDRGGPPSVPDFVKALRIDQAERPDVLLAYEMGGEPLPLLNGFPVRLVVPGWYATYWVKALEEITVLAEPFKGFWMSTAYRIPTTPNAVETPGDLAKETVPIHKMNVRSFFTSLQPQAAIPANRPCLLEGIAFDGGSGIRRVEVSADGGQSWGEANLGEDQGGYSFRRWKLEWVPPAAGTFDLLVRATANDGAVQPMTPGWNRAGYMRNVVEKWTVVAG